jgi:transcriptional regulator with GAF, ATPase, and Fis domain
VIRLTQEIAEDSSPVTDRADSESQPSDLESVERDHIIAVLHTVDWRISGPKGAAKILGLNPSTLRFRMKRLGIRRPGTVNESR